MVEQGHFAAQNITDHRDKLELAWKELTKAAGRRDGLLQSAHRLKTVSLSEFLNVSHKCIKIMF